MACFVRLGFANVAGILDKSTLLHFHFRVRSKRDDHGGVLHFDYSAVEAANNAEGQKQVLQAQTAILAANALAAHNGNEALANIMAMEAEEYYVRNYEKAMTEKMEQDSRESMARFCSH